MRPSPSELLASIRLSLNGTLLPHVEDRWARYTGNAMDLVLRHLELRLAGEPDALAEDSADMAVVLASIGSRAAALGAESAADDGPDWAALAGLLPDAGGGADGTGGATARNEELRAGVVAVLRTLDELDPEDAIPAVREMKDEVHRLIRRQVDRMRPMVEPLFMSFGPVRS
ncbi:hypothetical protein [Streptomyces armeniacus]|uniref:hypothetical protein n=1 Tax=Streptomyces armeniacus TaxID=83291 RepID=UPI001AD7F971|nr:hypothetical protein [Streptomyces armeniacus]